LSVPGLVPGVSFGQRFHTRRPDGSCRWAPSMERGGAGHAAKHCHGLQ